VFNLRWSGVAAAAAFVISLTLGILVRAHILVVLVRAFGFAAAFFFLAALLWRVVNRYLPELLQNPSPQDVSLMPGLEAGSRVNITVGDEIPRDAAVPPEEGADESVGNITETARPVYAARESAGPPAPPPSGPAPAPAGFTPSAPPAPAASAPPGPAASAAPAAPAQGMDQSPPSRYTQERAAIPAAPSPKRGFSGVSGLGDLSGGVESLPDLDALAGTFLSSGAPAGEEAVSSPASPGGGEYRSKKGKEVGEDFNPKELASAIQTILKRD
jgi:hypothetical protein